MWRCQIQTDTCQHWLIYSRPLRGHHWMRANQKQAKKSIWTVENSHRETTTVRWLCWSSCCSFHEPVNLWSKMGPQVSTIILHSHRSSHCSSVWIRRAVFVPVSLYQNSFTLHAIINCEIFITADEKVVTETKGSSGNCLLRWWIIEKQKFPTQASLKSDFFLKSKSPDGCLNRNWFSLSLFIHLLWHQCWKSH